jgi:hypothetical protein
MSWTTVQHGKGRKGDKASGSGSPWTCTCGFRNFHFRTSCFECGNEAPSWAQRLGKQSKQDAWKQGREFVQHHGHGDETQALKKQVEQLQGKLKELRGGGAEVQGGKPKGQVEEVPDETIEDMEAKLEKIKGWPDFKDKVDELQAKIEAKKNNKKPRTPGKCKFEVERLERQLQKAVEVAHLALVQHKEAETFVDKIGADLHRARQEQVEVAQREYEDKVGAAKVAKPVISIAKLIAGDADCFDFDEEDLFDGTDSGVTLTDAQRDELLLAKKGLKGELINVVLKMFGGAATDFQSAVQGAQKAKEVFDRLKKKRRTASGEGGAPVGPLQPPSPAAAAAAGGDKKQAAKPPAKAGEAKAGDPGTTGEPASASSGAAGPSAEPGNSDAELWKQSRTEQALQRAAKGEADGDA